MVRDVPDLPPRLASSSSALQQSFPAGNDSRPNVRLDVNTSYNQGRLALRKPEERQINSGSIRVRVVVETKPGSALVVFDKGPAAL